MNEIKLLREGPVARLSINQPAKRNAINRSMWRNISKLVDKVASDQSVRVMTIESASSGMFAAGADISEFESNYADLETTKAVNAEIAKAVESVAACPQPTLALIDGACIGGSVALVLACDIRVSSDKASYGVTPARLGLSYPPGDIQRLVAAMGKAAASELLFSGLFWPADRAAQAGLVNSVVPSADFSEYCQTLLDAICANSAKANRVLKKSIAQVMSDDAAQFELAETEFTRLFSSVDFEEGRDAFLQKRVADFPSNNE